MKKLILLMVIFLGACNQGNQPNPSASKQGISIPAPDVITNDGLIIFNQSGNEITLPDRETLDRWWNETEQCLNMTAEAPTVIISSNIRETCPQSTGSQGHYCEINGNWYVVILFDRLNWSWLWKHEFMHHILRLNDKPEFQNHTPDWLWQCQWN